MNALTLTCVVLALSACLEARKYNSNRPVDVTPIIEPIFPPVTSSLPPLTCEFGRQVDQQRRCTNFITDVPQCPRGFFCNFGPADEPGPCCLGSNPCRRGTPFQLDGDAVSCDRQSCPSGFRCTRGRSFAVCCPGTGSGPYPRPPRHNSYTG
uniref:Uncharacterized protein LOC111099030 n=1 Tax=Crassostrea virginica TaxID=6565 RepID=A0A8B8A4I9_CRAVI|nr:uncharacterized protein LOC111099030 [Crassostrea virginica]